nr:hypothetical protein [uncultured Deefgea sp.]
MTVDLYTIHVYVLMVGLGLKLPCSENRSEERDKQLYRLAHDEARAARSAFRPGRLLLLTSLGEAREVSAAAHSRSSVVDESLQTKKNRHGWRFHHFTFGVMRFAYYTLRAARYKTFNT